LAGRAVLLTQAVNGGPVPTIVTNGATDADGAFSIEHVQPGQYKLQALAFNQSRTADRLVPESAVVPISVNGADIVGVSVISMPGWSMSGRVTVEAGVRPESLR